jgi:hypothetical protein
MLINFTIGTTYIAKNRKKEPSIVFYKHKQCNMEKNSYFTIKYALKERSIATGTIKIPIFAVNYRFR